MARGVPTIASDVPGNKDAVADRETGFLYDLARPHLAAQHLIQLAHHPVLWKQMARAARRRAEDQFSVQSMADATLRLYSRPDRPGPRRPSRGAVIARPPSGLPVQAFTSAIQNSRRG
jgi:glycosyltransferase involved in cell wall biosynthesis